jgi:hypothetical protein
MKRNSQQQAKVQPTQQGTPVGTCRCTPFEYGFYIGKFSPNI